ncbi:unnamed protein product [Schistocephalus solidus]|uniref:Uncharacterized protein n=1 Tax=Schistocephalus solidus TaxID=70667 RepID=A0A183SWT4_SCHSO|nr:unnamed protein product [Schistocephalus solidus]
MIFSTRQLQDKCQEMRTHLYITLVDMKKAVDTVLSSMLMDAYYDEHPGIRITYITDGHLLSGWRMQLPMRVSMTTVHGLLFVADCALNTVTEEDMQRRRDLFVAGCANFELTISTSKTVVLHQLSPSAEKNAPQINVNSKM